MKAMGNCKRSIRYPGYVLLVFELAIGLFVATAAAGSTEPEPRFNLAPEFVETFDDPAADGWDLNAGATVMDGILRLVSKDARASYNRDLHNYTTEVRMRRTGPGAIGITYTTAGQDSMRLVLGGESIEARRVLPGSVVGMIVECPGQEPPELPVGDWFTLHLTQLDGMIIVGVDGVRLCDLYDPSPQPLLPGGLALTAVDDTAVEVDEVIVVPWVIENFDEPLSSAWDVSSVDTTPYIQEGKLIVPPDGYAVRTGYWKEMTFYSRVRRDWLVNAGLTYPGHVLMLQKDFIALWSEETEGQLLKLAEAPLPVFPEEPETATWIYVTVVVRNGEHHVLAYGIELLSVPGEAVGGPVSAEAIEGRLALDRLMLGPPLPLWLNTEKPGGEEPGEGQPGVTSADLAVTDLYPDQVPVGRLYLRITNNGPDTLQGVPVTVTCGGTATDVTSGALTTIPNAPQGTFSITLAPGQTQAFPTQIDLDLNSFDYDMTCTVSATSGSGDFFDPDPGNNTYTEEIDALSQGAPTADLAVTDLFPHHLPMGKLHLRITNNGPDALQAVPVTVYCGGVATNLASGATTSIPSASQGTFDITIAPGQTYEFPTQIDLDLNTFKYDLSCEVRAASDAFTDPVPGNNLYNECIDISPQAHFIQADLAVTDIYPEGQPLATIYCRITNHGPDALQNATVRLDTNMISVTSGVEIIHPDSVFTVTLQAGETGVFDTGYVLDVLDLNINSYEVTCYVTSTILDPVSSNNSYSETFPSPP